MAVRVAALLLMAACGHIGYEPGAGDDAGAMVAVPAGPFFMGCNAELDDNCLIEEVPRHEVTLGSFEIDVTEVTQQMYSLCIEAGVCAEPSQNFSPAETPRHPVTFVSWTEAAIFCGWAGKRLPTEAEWEKAARGIDGRIYPWGNSEPDCDMVNYDRCLDQITVVGSYPLNASTYGALDMAGNVSEWVADWYDADYYSTSPPENPLGPDSGSAKVIRGSSYAYDAAAIRTSNRIDDLPGTRIYGRGLRCVR